MNIIMFQMILEDLIIQPYHYKKVIIRLFNKKNIYKNRMRSVCVKYNCLKGMNKDKLVIL